MLKGSKKNKRTLCFIVSSKITVKAFLRPHIKELQSDYDITIMANISESDTLEEDIDVKLLAISIHRKINIVHDLLAFIKLYRIFRQERFDIIHSVTPKAGLLSMLAGWIANVPVRVHTFTGQVWANKQGFKRKFFRFFDKLIAKSATVILVDSKSQRDFLLNENVITDSKSRVLLDGSICGVDIERFSPNDMTRNRVREILGINDNALMFIYLGRISLDKGILDLAHAFTNISRIRQDIHLVIIGPDEDNLCDDIRAIGKDSINRIHILGYTDIPEDYMAAADVFCLPSYREGFGSVVIEAGSAGIPSIGSRIYGVKDAIQDGVTGLLFEPRNIKDLENKMQILIDDPDLRKNMGMNASTYARTSFDERSITRALKEYYEELQM